MQEIPQSMQINIENLAPGKTLDISGILQIKAPKSLGTKGGFCKSNIIAKMSNNKGAFLLKGRVTVELIFECARCLKPVEETLEFDIDEIFINPELNSSISLKHEQEQETIAFKGHEIDLAPVLISNLSMHVPMKVICSDDCLGLCSRCGANLNHGNCDCRDEFINEEIAQMLGNLQLD
ncbi:MAG: DUF177 domain-containing protein [Defluviitaleaceae bacterium]|nr:DUF177 domain-containing protein [Defluviitaleaceae bacterium]